MWYYRHLILLLSLNIYFANFIINVNGYSVVSDNDDEMGIGDEDNDEDAEEIYNKTYTEHATALEREIFGKYNILRRPAKNEALPTLIDVHWHIVHASINQEQQTMTLHGHLYMRWQDDYLGWDPDDYNGIRSIRAKKWQIWNPKIRVANSVSGVYSHHDISTSAHVLIQTHSKEKGAFIEMYPTFSIKVGCLFDYSNYPDDINKCFVAIYSPTKMTEVALQIYESLPPTLMLGWGEQADKRIVSSDFEIVDWSNELLYYRNGSATDEVPKTRSAMDRCWTFISSTITMKRRSTTFFIGVFLPCLVSVIISVCSFLHPSLYMAVYSIMSNYIIQITFLQEMVTKLPLSVSRVPDTVVLYGISMLFNLVSFFLHLFCIYLTQQSQKTPPLALQQLLESIAVFTKQKKFDEWSDCIVLMRTCFCFVFVIGYSIFGLYFLLN